jgi:hypothetical protein
VPFATVLTVVSFFALVVPHATDSIPTCWFAFFVETWPLKATFWP